jgi:hypothetical protein
MVLEKTKEVIMNTVPECDLKWDVWIQDFDGLGMIAKCRQAELRQDASLNRLENPVPSTQNRRANQFLQVAFDFAMALCYGIVPA